MKYLLLVLLFTASSAGAQENVGAVEGRGPLLAPVVGGVLGSAVGLGVGALVGAGLERCDGPDSGDFCGLGGFLLGGAVGGSAGSALGAYGFSRMSGGEPRFWSSVV